MKKLTFFVATVFIIFSGFSFASSSEKKMEGDKVKLGNGTVKSWVIVDDNNVPKSMGITFTVDALTDLPKPTDPGGFPLAVFPDYTTFEYVLKLPDNVMNFPFKSVGLNWNPTGHPPDCYNNSHFDVHFYMMDENLRTSITCMGDDTNKVYKQPDAQYIPQDYMTAPMTGEARMGCHWFDPNSAEFHTGFNKTIIYGFYDAKMVFVEPMITLDYLNSKPNVTETIKLPKSYQVSGYYPTGYTVKYDEKTKDKVRYLWPLPR